METGRRTEIHDWPRPFTNARTLLIVEQIDEVLSLQLGNNWIILIILLKFEFASVQLSGPIQWARPFEFVIEYGGVQLAASLAWIIDSSTVRFRYEEAVRSVALVVGYLRLGRWGWLRCLILARVELWRPQIPIYLRGSVGVVAVPGFWFLVTSFCLWIMVGVHFIFGLFHEINERN